MTRSKWLFVIANAIVVINVALWVGINADLGNAVTAVNYAFLIFTCAVGVSRNSESKTRRPDL